MSRKLQGSIAAGLSRQVCRTSPGQDRSCPVSFEPLEDRLLLSGIDVTSSLWSQAAEQKLSTLSLPGMQVLYSENDLSYTNKNGKHTYYSWGKAKTEGTDPGWLTPDKADDFKASAEAYCIATNADGLHWASGYADAILSSHISLVPWKSQLPEVIIKSLTQGGFDVPIVMSVVAHVEVTSNIQGQAVSSEQASAHITVRDASDTLFDQKIEASDTGNSQADMSPSVALMIHVVPIIGKASYIWIDLQAGAKTNLGLDDGGGSGEMTSKAWIDPVFTFDQAAFDAEADSMGFPRFTLADYFSLTIGPSSSGTSPNLDISTPDMLDSSDTGPSDSDDITGDRTPTFTGTVTDPSAVDLGGLPGGGLPPGVVIPPVPGAIGSLLGAKPKLAILYVDGIETGRGPIINGVYTITSSPLLAGEHNVMVTAGSDDKNQSMPSDPLLITMDPDLPASATSSLQLGLGEGALKWATWTDADGTTATVKLSAGSADLVFDGDGLDQVAGNGGMTVTGSNVSLSIIAMNGDTSKGVLSFSLKNAKGSDGQVSVGSITSDGDVQTISGKGVNLWGNIDLGGSIQSLTINDVLGPQHDLVLGGNGLDKAATLVFHNLYDVMLTSGQAIASLTAASWQDKNDDIADVISAPWLGKITASGDFAAGLDLSGDGVGQGKPALGTTKITGRLTGGTWLVHGSADAISAAGIDAAFTAIIDGPIKSITATSATAGAITAQSIGSFKVTGDLDGAFISLSQPVVAGQTTLKALGAMTVSGTMNNSILTSEGNITAVTVGRMIGSTIFAGVDTLRNAAGVVPDEAADFDAQAGLASFTIMGIRGQAVSMQDSVVAAFSLGTVSLLDLPTGGLASHKLVTSYTRKAGLNTAFFRRGPLSGPAALEQMDGYIARLV